MNGLRPREARGVGAAGSDDEGESGRLLGAVEALTTQVEALSNQVEVLRQVLDEVREEFQWALQNDKFGHAGIDHGQLVMRVTSMPKDPCAEDWEINRVSPENRPPDLRSTPTIRAPAGQAELWD